MEIAKQIGGFSPAEADDLRKAIGKKIHSLMASLKDKFITGCVANNTSESVARQLWTTSRSRRTTRSTRRTRPVTADLVSDRLAALDPPVRVHGRADLLGDARDGRVSVYGGGGAKFGIEVLPPDINSCGRLRGRRGKIRFGLAAVKNVGEAAARAIIRARDEGGQFESIGDFTEGVGRQVVNKRSLEALPRRRAGRAGSARMGMVACSNIHSHGGRSSGRRAGGAIVDVRPRRDAGAASRTGCAASSTR